MEEEEAERRRRRAEGSWEGDVNVEEGGEGCVQQEDPRRQQEDPSLQQADIRLYGGPGGFSIIYYRRLGPVKRQYRGRAWEWGGLGYGEGVRAVPESHGIHGVCPPNGLD